MPRMGVVSRDSSVRSALIEAPNTGALMLVTDRSVLRQWWLLWGLSVLAHHIPRARRPGDTLRSSPGEGRNLPLSREPSFPEGCVMAENY